jgi:Tfp pilus assembly protein FimT
MMDKDGEVLVGNRDNTGPVTAKDDGKVNNEVNNGENNSVNSSTNTGDKNDPNKTQRNTYARMVTKDVRAVNNRLSFVPTEISNEGNEFVILMRIWCKREVASGN